MAVSMRAGLVHRAPIATTTRRAALPRVRAGPSDQPPSSPSTSAPEVLDAEARIEALEASSRKAARRRGGAGGGAPGPRRSIPIRGQQPSKQQEQQLVDDQRAAWKEGSLLPEGWGQMPLDQKISELYLGRRGLLFWSGQLAWGASIGLAGGWVVFRFVLPALGVYKLPGDM